jgi:hypothetical protein
MNLIKELWNKLTQLKENKKGKDNICYDIAIKYKYTHLLYTNTFDNQKTKNMSDKKQTAVELILDKFNLLSDNDFKSWMLNYHDELIQMEQEQMAGMFISGSFNREKPFTFSEYYREIYGGKDE